MTPSAEISYEMVISAPNLRAIFLDGESLIPAKGAYMTALDSLKFGGFIPTIYKK
jgi:hypothetical protein